MGFGVEKFMVKNFMVEQFMVGKFKRFAVFDFFWYSFIMMTEVGEGRCCVTIRREPASEQAFWRLEPNAR